MSDDLPNAERAYRWLGDLDALIDLDPAEWRAALAGAAALAEASHVAGSARIDVLQDELASLRAQAEELRRRLDS